MSDPRPNFRLADLDTERCGSCKNAAKDANEATYCMLGAAGAAAEDGQRVNANFVCDAYAG